MADDQPNQDWKPKYNPWLIAVVVALAAFMEVLDTSICNVALPHIAGNLGASQEESTWVLTTYLVANAVVLPIIGWISNFLGRKRFYMICIVIFTASSLPCRRPSWWIPSLRDCAELHLHCTASRLWSHQPWGPSWAGGSPITPLGAGSS